MLLKKVESVLAKVNAWLSAKRTGKILKRSRVEYVDAMLIAYAGDYWDQYRKARLIMDKRCMRREDILNWEEYRASQKEVRRVVMLCRKAQPPIYRKTKTGVVARFFSLEVGNFGWC